jgi:hypothetical protein
MHAKTAVPLPQGQHEEQVRQVLGRAIGVSVGQQRGEAGIVCTHRQHGRRRSGRQYQPTVQELVAAFKDVKEKNPEFGIKRVHKELKAADRSTEPWQDVYTDLSGKVRTASVTGVEYFAVFVDSYLGSKHVEFSPPKTTSSLATNASSPTSDDNQKRFALIKALFNKELWKHIPRYWWMCHASGVRRDAADAPLRRSRHD